MQTEQPSTSEQLRTMFKRLNSMLVAEGKPPYKGFTLNAVVDFLTGRTMPDGTVWTKVSYALQTRPPVSQCHLSLTRQRPTHMMHFVQPCGRSHDHQFTVLRLLTGLAQGTWQPACESSLTNNAFDATVI